MALEQFGAARVALAAEIYPNVFGEMRHVINDLNQMTKGLLDALRAGTGYANVNFDSRHAPGKSFWEKLRSLADLALGPDHELRSFFEFGASLGGFQLKLWEENVGAIFRIEDLRRFYRRLDAGEPDTPLPDIRPLVLSALRLPEEVSRQIPQVRSLIELASELNGPGQDHFLKQLLWKHPDLCQLLAAGNEVDSSILARLTDSLDTLVQDGLRNMIINKKQRIRLEHKPKPSWNSDSNKLYFDGVLIRKLGGNAKVIRIILDAFEEEGWTEVIDNPLPGNIDARSLRDVTNSLNDKVKLIRFRPLKKDTEVLWEAREPLDTP